MAEPAGKHELFYSYAHKDEKLRNELEKHLFHLKRLGLIAEWYDRDISAGTEWEYEINAHLNSASIILLLISPDFIASEYCYSIEMTKAMERHEAGEARVIPIILRPSDWKSSPFSKLQVLPTNGRPVIKWQSRDEALLDVAKGIREAIKKLPPPSTDHKTTPGQKPANGASFLGTSLPVIQYEVQTQEANREPVWNIPYRRNLLFTSREDILQQIHETFTKVAELSSNLPLVLSGLGGMGKTQIAIEYAYRYRGEHHDHDILWAKADSQEVVISELVSFAALLNLPGQREQDQQYALSAVKRWLEVHSNWLLILDNIEDIKMANEYLPDSPQGHILFTAQTRITGGIAKRLDIDKMSPEDGALFLLRRADLITTKASLDSASEDTRTQAIEVVKMLDGLPLAIDQAGAYIEETGTSLLHYTELYASRRTDLLNTRGGLVSDHPSVTATMSLSFEKVEQSNRASVELLRFLAYPHPDTIPHELIVRSASQSSPLLQEVATNPLILDRAIGELLKYSLVRRNPDDATLSIHRLVQAVLKDGMDTATQNLWTERVVRSVNQAFPKVEFANWQTCQLYLPQAQICISYINSGNFTFPEAAQLLQKLGEYFHQRGQYTEAVPLIAQALTIRQKVLGSEHLDIAESLNELAELYREQGKYTEAEPLYQEALTIREHILGPEHPDVATSLNNLARPYHHQARYKEAEALYQRALIIREQALGSSHPDVAESLNDLATLYDAQARYKEAESLYQRALTIREQALGASHPNTAVSLNNLGTFYREQGRYIEAEPLTHRAL